MKKYYVGIDSGSTMCKTILFDGKDITDCHRIKTGWNPLLSAEKSLKLLLERNKIGYEDVIVSTTGYGREAIEFAGFTYTEITCHALGALFLSSTVGALPAVGGVIDIGGQDSKIILIHDGKVVNFLMNDKCAAGTGRFLSIACDTLGIDLADIDQFADPNEGISINSMCAVFAESEIIGLLAAGTDRSQILTGVLQSIGNKIWQMTGKLMIDESKPFLMTGGLSCSRLLMDIIAQITGLHIITHEYAAWAGAVGACICAANTVGRTTSPPNKAIEPDTYE